MCDGTTAARRGDRACWPWAAPPAGVVEEALVDENIPGLLARASELLGSEVLPKPQPAAATG